MDRKAMRLAAFLLCLPALAQVSSKSAISSRTSISTARPTSGGGLSLTVEGVSNTQALISYTAPSSSACTVEASESATYLPVVHDVDGALFTGAASDARDGNLGAGTTTRVISIGRRAADLALDSSYYSRALQAYTTHYARITCGASVGTTSFTTQNIPPGMTYTDYPLPPTPGLWGLPTYLNNDRTITQIDQYTGLFYKPLTIYDDRAGFDPSGFGMAQGGFINMCTAGLQTSSVDGSVYVCQFYETNNALTMFYAIRPSDGFVRKLGKVFPDIGQVVMGTDMCFIGQRGGTPPTTKYCYTGDWGTHDDLPIDAGTAYTSVSEADQLFAYDSSFNSTLFSCGPFFAVKFGYQTIECGRAGGGHDHYGWVVMYYGGDGRVYGSGSCGAVVVGGNCPGILAAFNPMAKQATRFQSLHNFQALPNVPTNPTVPLVFINWQGLDDNSSVGSAAWKATLVNDLTFGQTSLVVDTCPTSQFSGGDAFDPGCWAPSGGDVFNVEISGMFGDRYITTAASGSGPYTLTIAPWAGSTLPMGTTIRLTGNATTLDTTYGYHGLWYLTYWFPVSDPHGNALVKDLCFDPGGHNAYGLHGRIGESGSGFAVVYGNISTTLNTCPVPLDVTDTPTFHGLSGYCTGTACNKHSTYQQSSDTPSGSQRNHISDGLTWNGGDSFISAAATHVSGNLYKYNGPTSGFAAPNYAANKTVLFRKLFPTVAISGSYPYRDISGPSSVIDGTSTYNGMYCVVYIAGECVGSSAAGDIYLNIPYALDFLTCRGSDGPLPLVKDLCVGTFPTMGRSAVPQIYIDASSSTDAVSKSRMAMGGGVHGVRQLPQFSFAKIMPDSAWYLFQAGYACTPGDPTLFCNIWLAKNLPIPSTDAHDRSDFIPITATISSVPSMTTNVLIQFGYLENGTTSQFYCGSRAESCYVNHATIAAAPDPNPFSYPSDGSSNTLATLTGVSCSSSCTVDIPAISGRTLYYRAVYRDSGNSILSTGPLTVAVIP